MENNIVMEDKLVITPKELVNVEFSRGLRGYKEDEVDAYLEKVIETVENLLKKIESQDAIIKKQQKEIEKYEGMKHTLTATLLKAEANAEETYELAKKKANEIKEEAESECDKMIKNAESECDKMIKNAESERDKMIKDAEKRVDCIKEEYEDIKNKYTTFKNNYLEMLNNEIKNISSHAFEGAISSITEEEC